MKRIYLLIILAAFCFYFVRATDYYVNATIGSNLTGNGSSGTPWQTITYALSQIAGTGHTLYVAAGTYDQTLGETLPIQMKDGVSLIGEGSDSTIINGADTYQLITCTEFSNTVIIEGFKLTGGYAWSGGTAIDIDEADVIIRNNEIVNCRSGSYDGTIYIQPAWSAYTVVIEGNIIKDNIAGMTNYDGAAIEIDNIWSNGGTTIVRNNVIANIDGSSNDGTAISIQSANPVEVYNNTITGVRHGFYLSDGVTASIKNNIIANCSRYGIFESDTESDPTAVHYNLFYNNTLGHYFNENSTAYTDVIVMNIGLADICLGNIEGDPVFVDPVSDDYFLQSSSPAIDAGDPDPQFNDPDGSRNDIGAFAFDKTPAVPQNLTATAGFEKITLQWNPNIELDLNQYQIYRDLSSPATTLVDSVISTSPPDTFYVDVSLTIGQDYYYRITAKDITGNESDFSNEVFAIPTLLPEVEILHAGLTEENINGANIDLTLSNETFADATLAPASFTLGNAPKGTSVSGATYNSSTNATVTLASNGTDFDSNISDFSITVAETELTGMDDVISNELTITATNDPEVISLSDDGITEGSENGETITVTLSGGTFADPLTTGNWNLANLPNGVTKGSVIRNNAVQATITLSGNRTTDYDSNITNLTVSITDDEIDDHTGADIFKNTGVTFTAVVESATISHVGLTEANLNGALLKMKLINETFDDGTLDKANFSLNNAPPGTSINAVNYVNTDTATVTLAFNGIDFDINYTDFSVTINELELTGAGSVTSNNLTITAVIESATATITPSSAMTESNLDGMDIDFTLSNETFADATLAPANFTLGNAPEGTSVSGATYNSSTNVTVTLAFNGTDFDSDITNFYIVVGAIEVSGGSSVASSTATITATNDAESIAMTDDGAISEGNEDGEIITVTLTGGTFADPLTLGNWILTNLPDGVTRGVVSRTDATHATITLNGHRTTDYDNDITDLDLSVGEDDINDHIGTDISTNTGVTFTANDESAIISHVGLDENNLNGAVVGIKLSNETFEDNSLDIGNFTINNAPPGTTKGGVSYKGADTATITLAFDQTDFDADHEHFSVTILATELSGVADVASNELVIMAIVEPGVFTISHSGLTEENLDGADISLTLDQETFADGFLVSSNFTLNNNPTGVTVSTIVYNSPTTATLTVEFDGTDFDIDSTNFNITLSGIELTGANDLISNSLVITALVEPLIISLEGNNVTSIGGSDGSINLTVSEGLFPYTFSWSTGTTTEDISGLSAGVYSVTVTDARDSTATDSIRIYDSFTDERDGQVYKAITIGDQIWMAENLNSTHYADGTPLIDGTGAGNITFDYTTKYYFYYNDDSVTYADIYGALYTWAAVMNGAASSDNNPSGVQGVCPDGWHLPGDDEWKQLEMYLGMNQADADNIDWRGTDEGGKLKEAGTTHWNSPNTGATNSSGFTALPGGYRSSGGSYYSIGNYVFFYSSAELNSSQAWLRNLNSSSSGVNRSWVGKEYGYSVRCVKNNLFTDSLALVALYNSTDGANWTNNTNWLTGPVSTWIGITVSGGRVTGIDLTTNNLYGSIPIDIGNLKSLQFLFLGSNQLTGSIPGEIGNLTNLVNWELYNNQLTGSIPAGTGNLTNLERLKLNNNNFDHLPDLSSLTSLFFLEIHDNKFTFKDIEPNIGVASTTYTYAPQDSVGEIIDTTVYVGTGFTVSVSTGGASSRYQWKRGGTNIGTLSGDSTYTIDPVTFSDTGAYTCEITNTVATELTLYSRPVNITVIDTTAPAPPQNLTAIPGDGQIQLQWSGNSESDLSYYKIYRNITNDSTSADSINIISKVSTSYMDTDVINGTTYYYWISAVDSSQNESYFSNEVNAKPEAVIFQDWYVDAVNGSNSTGDGTQVNPWQTITYALSQITGSGHMVNVAAGTYDTGLGETFPILMKNGVSLVGAGTATTIIDANEINTVIQCVSIVDNSTRIEGFTLMEGSNSNGGGGIFVTAGSCLVITGNIIMNNKVPVSRVSTTPESRLGGGIYILNSSPKITNNQIIDNWTGALSMGNTGSGGWGGGIAVSGSASSPIIQNNTITGNQAINTSFASAYGGGIYFGDGASGTLTNNTISENYLRQLSATSGATRGGGIYISGSGAPIITGNMISNNTASAMYGSVSECSGIFIYGSSPTITNNVVAGNDFSGISLSISSSPTIVNNTISDNSENGIYISSSSPDSILNNVISLNSGYGIYESSSASDPGKVWYNLFYANGYGLYNDEGSTDYYTANSLNSSVAECENNIEGDPMFVDRTNGDYKLLQGSPAIDAGDPDPQFNDPDGSRNDMGAFPFVEVSSENDILSFSFAEQTGTATINNTNHTIGIEVVYDADLTGLVATFTLSPGASATVNSVTQESGVTANDFTNPVTYTVTAGDDTEQNWIVTVTAEPEPNSETDFITFSLPGQSGSAAINTINHTISVIVPLDVDVTGLVASFTLSAGASAEVNSVSQVSGVTANDFTNPVTYTVTAEDATTQDWVVTVTKSDVIIVTDGTPYFQDFESGDGGWVAAGTNSSWEFGIPAGSTINSAASGSSAWVTSLSGDHFADEVSFVYSPIFDLSGLSYPTVEFQAWWDCEGTYDGACLQYSEDTAKTWHTLRKPTDYMWYNRSDVVSLLYATGFGNGWSGDGTFGEGSNGWTTLRSDISYPDEYAYLRFRVLFASNGSYENDGFAFDDVKICNDPASGLFPGWTDKDQFSVYPNPGTGIFTLSGQLGRPEDLIILVLNLQGQVILTKEFPGTKSFNEQIDLSFCPEGIYILRMKAGDYLGYKKIIIQ